MRIACITCWWGGPDYARMTQTMLRGVTAGDDHSISWSITEQGVTGRVSYPKNTSICTFKSNQGFAIGMNRALAGAKVRMPDYEAVLCLNNDIEAPHENWIDMLIAEMSEDAVSCPTTNYTSVNEQRATAPADRDAFRHGVTPGVCWLIPRKMIAVAEEHLGEGKLFPEDLGGRAWGEDNYTAGLWRHKIHPKPFMITPRSWIKHLGSKTSSKIPADERMRCHREAHARMKKNGW